jgi:hypothetical protein
MAHQDNLVALGDYSFPYTFLSLHKTGLAVAKGMYITYEPC